MENHFEKLTLIESDRLMLRPLNMNDIDDIERGAGSKEVYETTANIPHPYNKEHAIAFVNYTNDRFKENNGFTYAIINKANNQMVGCIGINYNENQKIGELGYWIMPGLWGNGFCSEAAIALIDAAFENIDYNRIYAEYLVSNPASKRVMEKAGMTFEGILREAYLKGDVFHDLGICSIIRSEWENKKRD